MVAVDGANAVVAMGALGLLALLVREPMVFPSLGATAYLMLAHPHEHQSRFRNAFFGHLAGAVIGWLALKLLVAGIGPVHVETALAVLSSGSLPGTIARWLYVAASAVAIGLTLVVMVATGIEHSPACSTTLLFALGVFQHWWQIGVVLGGVVVLVVCGTLLNHLAGYGGIEECPQDRAPILPLDGDDLRGPGRT